mgnify:FL=1
MNLGMDWQIDGNRKKMDADDWQKELDGALRAFERRFGGSPVEIYVHPDNVEMLDSTKFKVIGNRNIQRSFIWLER